MAQFKIIVDAKKSVEPLTELEAPGNERQVRKLITAASMANRLVKKLEAKRKELNAPHQAKVKENGAQFGVMKLLENQVGRLRELILDFMRHPTDAKQNALPAYDDIALEGLEGGVAKLKTLWDFSIDDQEAFLKAHPEYITVNESLLKTHIRRKEEPIRELTGVTISNEQTLELT